MRMAVFTLPRDAWLREISSEILRDLCWAHARPSEGIEHIHVNAGPDRVLITLFVLVPDQIVADAVATDVCRRLLALALKKRAK